MPSPALVVGVIALIVALAGSAVALPGKNKVDKNDIKKGAVTKKAIKKGAVTSKAIKAGAVGGNQLADGSVGGAKVADGAVTTAKLAPEARTYSLRVAANGTSFGGSPSVTSERVGEGLYFVRFPVDLRNYGLVASPSGGNENPDARVYINRCGGGPGEIGGCSPADVNNNPLTLFIETNNDGDITNEDLSFDIVASP